MITHVWMFLLQILNTLVLRIVILILYPCLLAITVKLRFYLGSARPDVVIVTENVLGLQRVWFSQNSSLALPTLTKWEYCWQEKDVSQIPKS